MTREEQIKEITMLTCSAYCRNKEKKCAGIKECDMKCLQYQRCEIVYDNANYHKQEKAEWIEHRWTTEDDWGCINHRSIECSACKIEIYKGEPTEYCPHCGAEMQETAGRR